MTKNSKRRATKKTAARPVFDSVRKPLAPPGHALTRAKPEERAHPAERKAKHKSRPDAGGDSGESD
jgi:hypothetical protein